MNLETVTFALTFSGLLDEYSSWLFQWICHQDPSRLFHVGGHALQLCPRCIGLHAGFMLGAVAIHLRFGRRRPPSSGVASLAVLGTVTALHWMYGWVGLLPSAALERFLTGLLSGLGGGGLFASYQIHKSVDAPEMLPAVAGGLLAMTAAGLLILSRGAFTAHMLLTLAALVTVLINAFAVSRMAIIIVIPRSHTGTAHTNLEMHHDTLNS